MDEHCSVYQTVDIIAKKWVLVILLTLYKGLNETLRYSEIKEQLPDITPKVLSARLKELEKHGIVKKQIDASEFPVKCHYSLTESGKDIVTIIRSVKRWALRWKIKNELCEHIDCKECEL
jgi:DNA-binding HxlR family transcriptional regulator